MDLRNVPTDLPGAVRSAERRSRIESELEIDLSKIKTDPETIGDADEKNCEQMFGQVPIPVGYAGPLTFTCSSGETITTHLPLATTEGALVASVNRGCKILSQSNLKTESTYHGMTRSICVKVPSEKCQVPEFIDRLKQQKDEWKAIAESTSNHLEVMDFTIDTQNGYVFLTIACDTDEAMGMNMTTIAAQAVGEWMAEHLDCEFVTVAANVDSDKKPSKRTHDEGRGYEVTATAEVPTDLIESILKTTPEVMAMAADAKLNIGSEIAGAIGSNCHAANMITALYLATGQDAAHVVEGSLADTTFSILHSQFSISTRLPAVLIGVRGGGTDLPAQRQCLDLILNEKISLHLCKQLAESIGAAVLAGEISLLAAQASHSLAKAHKSLARNN